MLARGPTRHIHCERSRVTAPGRDLPDADGPEFVSLNGGFGEANRSLVGRMEPVASVATANAYSRPKPVGRERPLPGIHFLGKWLCRAGRFP